MTLNCQRISQHGLSTFYVFLGLGFSGMIWCLGTYIFCWGLICKVECLTISFEG